MYFGALKSLRSVTLASREFLKVTSVSLHVSTMWSIFFCHDAMFSLSCWRYLPKSGSWRAALFSEIGERAVTFPLPSTEIPAAGPSWSRMLTRSSLAFLKAAYPSSSSVFTPLASAAASANSLTVLPTNALVTPALTPSQLALFAFAFIPSDA